ncbi:hypothetical protein [Flavobacterium sp. AED]|uniref:hypothetical protein n=1 Tax=Flavobacterium sp. AED TaxID=1423323 RepID=UPI00057C386E|nr:hypothetical protein [Flavobacterium sp. AED]KIA86604.1 hypothetical protein OA85_02855 [Flavobacterium sp. AED]
MEVIEAGIQIFNLLMAFGGCFFIGYIACIYKEPKRKKKRKSKFPKCDCKDPNDCSKWCHAKELFTKDSADGKL